MKKIFLLPILALSLIACEKTITFDLPTEDPQLALTSRIVAKDSVVAVVSISSPALRPKLQYSEDAIISLYENGVVVDTLRVLTVNPTWDQTPVYLYSSSYDCEPDKTYKIKAMQSGFDAVEGSVIVPKQPVISNTSFNTGTREIKTTIQDPQGSGDVYRIEIVGAGDNDYPRGFYSKDLSLEFYEYYDEFLDIDGDGKYGSRAYIRDEFFDGAQRKIELTYDNFFGDNDEIYLKITALSNSQYEFEKSLDLATFGGDGPFSEPLTVYSNMSNLKGNFGAEYSTSVRLSP